MWAVDEMGWVGLILGGPIILIFVLGLFTPLLERVMKRRRRPMIHEVIEEAERQGDYKLAQELRLKRAWSLAKEPTGFFRIDQLRHDLPEGLDPMNETHLELVESIKAAYSNVLGYPEEELAKVMFWPESVLPFPKEWIRAALLCLTELVEGKGPQGRLVPTGSERLSDAEYLDVIGSTLDRLDDFIDVPRELIPLDLHENLLFGFAIREGVTVKDALERVENRRETLALIRKSPSDPIERRDPPDD